MKFKYLIIVIAVGSLLALYGLSLLSQPLLIPLSSLSTYNGQRVIVQGIVIDYRTTASGSQLISLRDTQNSTNTITLYIEGGLQVEFGDTIQAIGEVQQYKNDWELVVNDPKMVTILQKWHSLSIPLWQLALHPEHYRDTTVNVTGIVTQTSGSSFTLTSTDGTYSIEGTYRSTCPHQFIKGDSVTVGARFLYDATTCRFFLKATEDTHGIWRSEG
jgi:cytochrome c-type biogenesis protein CcmE